MLNEQDIEMIRKTRDDITQLRTVPVILHRTSTDGPRDPLTGEQTKTTSTEPAECTWSNLTTGGPGTDDITMVGGVIAESGDAIANFDIAYDFESVTHVERDGEMWRVRSKDEIGLGVPNRHYVLLKEVK